MGMGAPKHPASVAPKRWLFGRTGGPARRAFASGRPLSRSQRRVVSRWLLIPIAALAPADAVLGEHPTYGPDLGLPEKPRIVLVPAGLRIDLWMLLLGHPEEGRTLVEEERPRAARTLVEGEEIAHRGLWYSARACGRPPNHRPPLRRDSTCCKRALNLLSFTVPPLPSRPRTVDEHKLGNGSNQD